MKGAVQHRPDRGKDAYIVRWYVGRDERGRKKERTRLIRARTLREAQSLAVPIFAEFQAADQAAAERKGTIADLADTWLKWKQPRLSISTYERSYKPIVDRIVARFGYLQARDLTARMVDEWYDELATTKVPGGKHTYTARAIQRHHGVLRAMLRQGVKWDVVDTVVTDKTSPPSPGKVRRDLPTAAALDAALSSMAGDMANVARLAVTTGLRLGELMGLVWGDVIDGPAIDGQPTAVLNVERSVLEPRGGGLVAKEPKTEDSRRKVLMMGEGVAALHAQRELMRRQLKRDVTPVMHIFADVIADPSGRTPRRPSWVTRQWRAFADGNGLPGMRFHDLRHEHASHLISRGVDVAAVSARLGHSKITTTLDMYTHATEMGQLEAARAANLGPERDERPRHVD